MAAVYFYHFVQNHPFIDGNKRVGLEAGLVILDLNDLSLNVTTQGSTFAGWDHAMRLTRGKKNPDSGRQGIAQSR